MGESYRFDVIIIGAGPAGIACAYKLAQAGKKALVIERASRIGSKNLTGGRLYTYALELVESGLYKTAALERSVIREQVMVLGEKSSVTMDYYNPEVVDGVPQSYTILRANFDEWFATFAERHGVVLVEGIRVDELVEYDGRIVGVKAGDDVVYANTVVAADGVNSLFAERAGLRTAITAHSVGVGVKEVIAMPSATIESRFNLKPGQGLSRMIVGGTQGVIGGGFLYTNKESVSLGVVLKPESVADNGINVNDIFQNFKLHPALHSLIGDGETVEYGAHLVSEAGWRGVPSKLYRPGFLIVGDAAGFVINTGLSIRGIDLAILSGIAAAQALINADSVEAVGPLYLKEMERLKLTQTMRLFEGWPDLTGNPRMSKVYPNMINDMMSTMFTVDGQVPEKINRAMLKIARQHVGLTDLLADGWRGFRSI